MTEQKVAPTGAHWPLELRLLPELRRSLLWCGLGIVVCSLAVHLSLNMVNEKSIFRGLPRTLLWTSLAGWLLVQWGNHVRVRLDAQGIHRRILFHWQHWGWELFNYGNVELGRGKGSFLFTNQPWYRKNLSVYDCFDKDGADLAVEICMSYWTPPERDALPAELKVRYRLLTVLRLTANGITVTRFGKTEDYRWDEVSGAKIRRATLNHEDFTALEFVIGGRRMVLVANAQQKNFMGAAPRIIAAFFEAYLPPANLRIYDDTVLSVEEAEERLAAFRKSARASRITIWIAFGFIAVYLVSNVAVPLWKRKTPPDVYTLLAIVVMIIGASLWLCVPMLMSAELHKEELKLTRKKDELSAAKSGETKDASEPTGCADR